MKRPNLELSGPLMRVISLMLVLLSCLSAAPIGEIQTLRIEPESDSIPKTYGGSGLMQTQDSSDWSGGRQLWWQNAKVGDSLELTIQVPSSGYYRVATGLTQAVDYGIFDFSIGGKVIARNVDCYSPTVKIPPALTLADAIFLDAGSVKLVATLRGSNPLALKKFMLGWDYVDLIPLQNPILKSLTVPAGGSPTEFNLSQHLKIPADWIQPVTWQISDLRPAWINLTPEGVISIAPPYDSPSLTPFSVFAKAKDSSALQRSQPFILNIVVSEPSLPPEGDFLFSPTLLVSPGSTSEPMSISGLLAQKPELADAPMSLHFVSSNGQFQTNLQAGQLTVNTLPHAIPGSYAVYIAVIDPQKPTEKKLGRVIVHIKPSSLPKPDVRVTKSITRGDTNIQSTTLDLEGSLGSLESTLVAPLTFAKLPTAQRTTDEVMVIPNGPAFTLTAPDNPTAPEVSKVPLYFTATDSASIRRTVTILVDLTVNQPSIPQDVAPSDRFTISLPVMIGSTSPTPNLRAKLPQNLNVSENASFSIVRNTNPSKLWVQLSPEGDFSVNLMPAASQGVYPAIIKITDGSRTLYGNLDVQLNEPNPPPPDFELTAQAVIGQDRPVIIDLSSNVPPGMSSQSQWTMVANPSSASVQVSVVQNSIYLIPTPTAIPGQHQAFLKVSGTQDGQPVEKFAKLRLTLLSSTPPKIDVAVSRDLVMGSPSSPISLSQLLPQSMGLQGPLTFDIYSNTASVGGVMAAVSSEGQLMLNVYQGTTTTTNAGVYPIFVSVTDSASTTIFVQVNVQIRQPEPPTIDAELALYHDLSVPPLPVNLSSALQQLSGGNSGPGDSVFYELLADNAPSYVKKVDPSGFLAVSPEMGIQPGSQSVIVKASSYSTGTQYIKVWLHGVGASAETQPSLQTRLLASKSGSSQTIALTSLFPSPPPQNTSWSVDVLDNPLANAWQFKASNDGKISVSASGPVPPISARALVRIQSQDSTPPLQAIVGVEIDPRDFSTSSLLAHYDAARKDSIIAAGNWVEEWKDLSGNNHHLSSASGFGPQISSFSTLQGLDFFPEKGLQAQAVPLGENVTIFMAIKPSAEIRTWGSYIHHGNHDDDWAIRMNGPPGSKTGFHSSNDNEIVHDFLDPNFTYVLVGRLETSPNSGTDRRSFKIFRSDGNESTISSSTLQKTISSGVKPLYVGKSDSGESSNAKIGEILYFSSALADGDISVNASYLISKWMGAPSSTGGGQSGGESDQPPSIQVPVQTVFRTPGASLDLNQFVPFNLGLAQPLIWSLGSSQPPEGIFISPNGELSYFPTAEDSSVPTLVTLSLSVSEAYNPQKKALITIPIELANFTHETVSSAIPTPVVQLTVGAVSAPVNVRTLLETAIQTTPNLGVDLSSAQISLLMTRSNNAFSATLLAGDILSLELRPDAFAGAYDLFLKVGATTVNPTPKLFRVPIVVNGPIQPNVDLVLAKTIVRGGSIQINAASEILAPLGILPPVGVEIINPSGLAAGLTALTDQSGSVVISAGPTNDGLSKESLFIKVRSNTPEGISDKMVRVDCTVSAFSVPAGSETFTAEITVPGVPNQDSFFSISQLAPWNIASDAGLKYRLVDSSVISSKGIEAAIENDALRLRPLIDFIPGKTQLILEGKSEFRTVYGTLTVNQSAFVPQPSNFEVMVQSPIGGSRRNPVDLSGQLGLPQSTTNPQVGSPLPQNPEVILEAIYNSSRRGISASLLGTSLVSLDVAQTAYLGKNVIYLKRTDVASGAVSFGKLVVDVLQATPEQVSQEIAGNVSLQATGAFFDIKPHLTAPLANRDDLEFSLYSFEGSSNDSPTVTSDGVIQFYSTAQQGTGKSQPLTVHLAVREIASGFVRYITAHLSFPSDAGQTEDPATFAYLDINQPASVIDLHKLFELDSIPEQTFLELTRNSNASDLSVKVFGRYAVITPSTSAQPGVYSLQFRLPSEGSDIQPGSGDLRELVLCAHGESISNSTAAPYLATADWDSPSNLQLVSGGTVSLKIAANQAQNFLRAEFTGGSVKFFADRSMAIPGTYKVKITDPRAPQVQLNVSVTVPHDIFRPLQDADFVVRREFLEGQSSSVDLRSLFTNLNISDQYTFSIPASLQGNPLFASVSPAGVLTLPGFSRHNEFSTSDFSAVETWMSWEQAKEDASKRGGHLATFSSEAEWSKMISQVGWADGLWIGGTDQLNEGKWQWVTGEPWGFEKWAGGEPNNWGGGENYISISGSRWNDASGGSRGYVLETPLSFVLVKATDSGGNSKLLRIDVAFRPTQARVEVELAANGTQQPIDLNLLTGSLANIGPNRVWELEASEAQGFNLTSTGQLFGNVMPKEDHVTLTARVRDTVTNQSAFVNISLRSAKPQMLEIVKSPMSQTVNTGSRIILTVEAQSPLRGSQQLSYQWRKNGLPVPGAIFDAYTAIVNGESKGEYDVVVSDGTNEKVSSKAFIDTNDALFAGHIANSIQTVIPTGASFTLQQQVPGFRIRQVVLSPSPSLGSVNTMASADLILSLPSSDSRVASTYVLFSPTLNHYGDGESGHYPGKVRLPASSPSYALKAEASLFIPSDGVYTFGVNSDDGSRIVIDGVQIMLDDSNHGAQDFLSQPVTLTAGLHSLEVTMFEGGGGDHIEFYAARGSHFSWNSQFSLVGSAQGLKVFSTPLSATQSAQTATTSGETLWFDEVWMPSLLGGAGVQVQGSASLPASSGQMMIKMEGDRNDVVGFSTEWKMGSPNAAIFLDIFIPQESTSSAFMIQVNSRNGWEHRAVWGDLYQTHGWGAPDTYSRKKLGELPAKGQWTRLQLPLNSLGITSGDAIREVAFSQIKGLLYIDRIGLVDQPSFQWCKDGVAISGANTQSLKLTSAQTSDSGLYSLQVSDSVSSISSSSVYLHVRELVWDPSEIMHPLLAPVGTQYQLGANVKLSALVSGPADVRYEWRKNGQILPVSSAEISIPNASPSDAGMYTVSAVSDSILRRYDFTPVQLTQLAPPEKPLFPITSAPRNLQVTVGSPLTLTDSATGSGITYSWTKNGQLLAGFQTDRLFIPVVSAADSGQYTLVATNAGGSAVSQPFNVIVATPPVFSAEGQPKPLSLMEGDLLELIGIANGAVSYQWYVNGMEIAGATSNAYRILKASATNAGFYKVVAKSSLGLTAESQSVRVDVFSRPFIRFQPQPQIAPIGSSVTLSVLAQSDLPLSYRWFRDGVAIEGDGSFLSFPTLGQSHLGEYFVVIRNAAGEVVSQKVRIDAPPTFDGMQEPVTLRYMEGERVVMTRNLSGSAPMSFQWFKNGTPIAGAVTPTLVLDRVSTTDTAGYYLEIRNPFGTAQSPAQVLEVLSKLKIVAHPVTVTVNTGSPVILSVNATSSFGPIRYQWRRNARAIPGAIFPMFGIESMSAANQGLYDVVVSDSTDTLTSSAANLAISDTLKTTLRSSTPHAVIRTGEQIPLSVDAPLNATVQWRKDGLILAEPSRTLLVSQPGIYDAVVSNTSGRVMTRQFVAAASIPGVGPKGLNVRQVRARTWVGNLSTAETLVNLPKGHSDIADERSFIVPQLNLLGDGGDGHYPGNYPLPLGGEPYAIRATGTILIPETGIYTFGLNSDDGGTIRIDGKPVMIDDSNHGPVDNLSKGVSLDAGHHSIEVIMWEGGGGDEVELFAAKGSHIFWNGDFKLVGAEDGIAVTAEGDRAPDFVRFLRIPVSIDTFSGQAISVSAYAITSSTEPLTYQWSKGGEQIPGISGSGLYLGKLALPEDSGSFRLLAVAGETKSEAIDFSVNISDTPTPPQLVENLPTELNLSEGTQLLLSSKVVGSAPLAYEWFKDGKALTTKSPEFARTSATRADAGTYLLKVSNPYGELNVGPVTVSVSNSPIRMVSLPKPLRVGVGSPAFFAVEAIGSELIEYQWSKDGTPLIGQQSKLLQIPRVDMGSAGIYEVRASYVGSPNSAVTANVTLAVEPLPQLNAIKIQPSPNFSEGVARVRENAVIGLSIAASGSGPFKFIWSKSGTPIGEGSADLMTRPLTLSDSGAYAVRVESPFGSVLSEAVQIRVVQAPKIAKQPRTVSVREGAPFNLAIEALSTEPLSYRWRKDNQPLDNESLPVLKKSVSNQTDTGIYTVAVSDGISEILGEPIQVNILPEFEIKSHPNSVGAASNQDVEFMVVTESASPLRYQWLKDGVEISGAIAASLRIKSASPTDAGNYSVRVTSTLSSRQLESNVAKLMVDAPLTFTRDLDPKPRTLGLNEPTTFEVQVSGGGTIRYRWEVSDDKGPWKAQLAIGPKFTLPGSPKESSREVRVSASNGGPNTLSSQTAQVIVEDVPAIVAWSSPQTARVGARAEMSLSVSGAGAQIAWTKGTVQVPASRLETVAGITKSTLSFAQVSATDAGVYTATVTSPRSVTPLSRTFELVVNESPFQITKQPINVIIKENQAGRLSIGFESGSPDISFQWKKSGVPIPGQTSPVLNIFKAKLTDEGSYTVEVTSKLLTTPVESDPATITVETAPRIVRQPEGVTVRETNSANLEVLARGSSDLMYQWFTSKSLTGTARQPIQGGTGARLDLTNVSVEQSGFYWVEISNSQGAISSDRMKVEVIPALNITSLPKSADVPVGGTATLSVSVDSLYPESVRYQWYRLPVPQSASAPSESPILPQGAKSILGADGSSLLIDSITEEDSAEYLVEIVDSTARKVARGAIIRAIVPPSANDLQFSARPESSSESTDVQVSADELIVGSSNRVNVKMNVSGSLPATATLTINGQVLASAEITSATPSLAFKALKQHEGPLKLTLTNVAGSWESASLKLTVSDSVRILAQPQSISTDAQSRVELAVRAIGVGKLTYRWSRNGTLLGEGTNSRWLIPRASNADAGVYQVRVSDGFTNEISSGAVLELRSLILLQPIPATVKVGQPARLRVELSSDDYDIQWLKSGVPVPGATSSVLAFTSVDRADFGIYQALITNRTTLEETRSSEAAILEMPDLSNLSLEGAQQVKTGESLTLSVGSVYSSVLPGATYQWFKNFQPIPGAIASSLSLTQAAVNDAGVYSVKITSNLGASMSKPFNLTVNEPDLLFNSSDIQVTATAPAVIDLTSFDKASVGFASFEMLPRSNRMITAAITGRNTLRLTVPSGVLGIKETFDVRVFDAGGLYLGKGRLTASVPAGAPPVISQHPVSVGVPRDGTASLSILATGGSLRYQWRLNDNDIEGANAPILSAKAAEGRYDCVVSNEAGSTISAPATVFEVDAPVFVTQPSSIKGIAVGSSASLWVSVSSTYPVSYQWFKDGVAIDGQVSRVLNVLGFTPADEGAYHVVATNKFGVFAQSEPAAISLSDASIRIIAQPQSQSVLEDTPVTLQIVAKGPDLAFAWFKQTASGPIKVGESRILELSANDAGGTFVCEVSSPSASPVLSVPATIRVIKSEFSINDTKLSDKRVSSMDSLSLGVTVNGEGSFSYQWMKDGVAIESTAARRDTLVIQQMKESDAGTYFVRVSRGSESLVSKSVTITVAAPLTFVTHPTTSTEVAHAGQSPIVLTALASDSASLYQWRKNGVAIPNAVSTTYVIKPTSTAESGTYDVIASTLDGTKVTGRAASQSVFIRVINSLRITGQPRSLIANPGDGLALEVSTDGGNPTFQWFFKKAGSSTAVPLDGQTLSRLEIASASADHEGVYFAEISSPNQSPLTSTNASVKINKPVTITKNLSPSTVTLGQGKALMLQVAATGTPPLRYQWRKDGTPITNATNQRLIISNSKSASSGVYDCVISNIVGPVNSLSVPVVMAGRLEITDQPNAAIVLNPGESFSASIALANATGTEKVQWYRNSGKITRAVSGATSLTLTIPEVKEEDEASYFAVVTGQVRLTSKLTTLKVNKAIRFVSQPPQDITVFENRDITLPVQVTGTATKDVPITYQWYYNGAELPGARSSSLIIKNAQVSASGAYSVTASNIVGKVSSNEIRVTVSPGVSFTPIYAIVNGSKRPAQAVITENPSSTATPVKFQLATDVVSKDFVIEYHWRLNGRRILDPSAESAVLDFGSLGNAEAGLYDVVITTKTKTTGIVVDETTLDAVQVIVNRPVVVDEYPLSQGSNTGAQIELRAQAGGTGLKYQWMRQNPVTMLYEAVEGATSPTLPITVDSLTQGKYQLTLEGAVNTVTLSEINVWLLDSVTIAQQPENTTAIEGETATLTVDARATDESSGNLSYRWRKNRETAGVIDGKITSIQVVQRGSGYRQPPTIEILSTGQGSGATAQAEMVLDPSGETFSVAKINVTNGGSGYDSAPQVRIVGDVVSNLDGTIGRQAVAGVFFAPQQQSTPELVLQNVTEADEGQYYVEVFDGPVDASAPRLTSQMVTLTVKGKAKIVMQPTSVTGVEGLPFDLAVMTSGNEAVYQWTKLPNGGSSAETIQLNADTPTLQFPSLAETDAGLYRLTVTTTNPLGEAISKDIQLTVIALPKELSQMDPLLEKDPLESFYIVPNVSTAPQGQTFFYQWFKDDREIIGAVGRTLFINQASEADEGRYRLEVYSQAGILRASPVDLSVNDVPRVIVSPENISVDPETPFSLSVSALGKNLTYQWFLNGVAIPDANTSTYSNDRAVNGETEGVYSVVISSSTRYGGVGESLQTTAKATVTVKDPTSITKQPAASDVSGINLNASRTWTVEAVGTNLRYQWQKNGTDIVGATQKSYRLADAQPSDEGVYRVVVTGDLGASTSADFILEINKAPSFQSQPQSISAVAGDSVEIPSDVTGSAPLRFQWRKDGRPIASQVSSSLKLSGISTTDAGSYDVVVSNPVGTIRSAPFRITVVTPPVIISEPTSVVVIPGESPVLSVIATGAGSLSYQWFKDGELIDGANDSNLLVPSVSRESDGRYTVNVSNAAGSTFSQSAKLTVLSPVEVTLQPTDTRVLLKGRTSLSVEVSEASLPVSYQWRKNGLPIANATAKSLTFPSVQAADAGDYDVVITNDAGSVTSSPASLSIDSAMIAPTLPATVLVNQGSGTSISVTPTGSGPFTYQWRKNGQSIIGATEDVLVFEFASVTDSGIYDVVISNPSSSVTSTKTDLRVNARITITKQPESVLAANNDSVSLKVAASAANPLAYQWRKNGTDIVGATDTSLPLKVNADSAGVYDVIISETANDGVYSILSAGAAVEVTVPVKIVSKPQSLSVFQGDGAAFEVIATGTGKLTYSWTLGGKPIPNETSYRLVIPQVTSKPPVTLNYGVTVSDGKTTESATATLTVRARPTSTALAAVQSSSQSTSTTTASKLSVRSYSIDARPVANSAPFEGSVYLDAETESAVITELNDSLASSVRAPETGVTVTPALTPGDAEALKLEFRSNLGAEIWSLQGPASLVDSKGDGSWMAPTLVGLRKVYDASGKLIGTWMISLHFEETVPALPPAVSGASAD